MNKNEKTVFKILVEGMTPSIFAERIFPKQLIDEPYCFEAMDHVREQNIAHPENSKVAFEHDAVFCFARWRSYKPNYPYEQTTLSIEIKTTLGDLLEDDKVNQYLGATPWMAFAVPEELIPAAICKIREDPLTMPFKGLINATTGEIVIMPKEQKNYVRERCTRLHGQMHASKKRMPWYDTEGLYQIHYIQTNPIPKPVWKRIDGIRVNGDYANVVLEEKNVVIQWITTARLSGRLGS